MLYPSSRKLPNKREPNPMQTNKRELDREQIRDEFQRASWFRFGGSTVKLTDANREKVAQCSSTMQYLTKNLGAVWGNEGDSLLVEVGGIKLTVDSIEDCYVINEIFGHELYRLGVDNRSRLLHVIDIGAHLLMASLYFAGMDQVKRVTALEPMKQTYDKAKKHLEMNPELAKKITLHHFGLSDEDRTLSVGYSPWNKASTRAIANETAEASPLRNLPDFQMKTAVLRKASTFLGNLISRSENEQIVLKVDCEGSETCIIKDLSESGLIEKISIILMEWHGNNQADLEKLLLHSEFQTIAFRLQGKADLGMIYAFNKRASKPTEDRK
jgi:FkbM family methyltransferase